MSAVVVVSDPAEGQSVVPKNKQDGVLALMPEGGKQEWRCGNGCYGFAVFVPGGGPADAYTVWVISTECAQDLAKLPRELVREAMYR